MFRLAGFEYAFAENKITESNTETNIFHFKPISVQPVFK